MMSKYRGKTLSMYNISRIIKQIPDEREWNKYDDGK